MVSDLNWDRVKALSLAFDELSCERGMSTSEVVTALVVSLSAVIASLSDGSPEQADAYAAQADLLLRLQVSAMMAAPPPGPSAPGKNPFGGT